MKHIAGVLELVFAKAKALASEVFHKLRMVLAAVARESKVGVALDTTHKIYSVDDTHNVVIFYFVKSLVQKYISGSQGSNPIFL